MKTPEPNKPVLAYNGEYPHIAYYNSGRWYEAHTHELIKNVTHWQEIPELKPTKPKTAINQAIDEIHQEIANSKNPDALTKRGGEYRIGLRHAIVILMGLAEVEKEQILHSYADGQADTLLMFKQKISKMKDIPSEFNQLISENFWDLV